MRILNPMMGQVTQPTNLTVLVFKSETLREINYCTFSNDRVTPSSFKLV